MSASTVAVLAEVRAMARWLTGHGVPVFPLAIGGKTPATRGGFKDATTDPATITGWWAHRPYNVGIPTGAAGLVVVDLDTPKTLPDGTTTTLPEPWAALPGVVDGADVLAVLADRAGAPFPWDTRTVLTPSGGVHLYFTAPHGIELGNTAGKLGPMIDTRATGGYVVAPPSRTAAGAYVTTNPAPPAPLPAWLLDALTPTTTTTITAAAGAAGAPRVARMARHDGGPVDGYAFAAFEREVDAVLSARPGTRNHTLNRAAYSLGTLVAAGRLPEHQVIAALTIAAEHIGLTDRETTRTITSALDAAAHAPRTPQTRPTWTTSRRAHA